MADSTEPFRVIGDGFVPDSSVARSAEKLRKQHPSFDEDMAREVAALNARSCQPPDDAIPGGNKLIWKRRARCSDNTKGKSGGYRIIYGVFPQGIAFLSIYCKTEVQNVEIERAMAAMQEVIVLLARDPDNAAAILARIKSD